MIHLIADKLVTEMATMPIKDKITGIVKPARVKHTDGQLVTFPIAYNKNPAACTPSELLDYVPDSTKATIIFFEDYGTEQIGEDSLGMRFAATLRLICWFNYKRLSGAMNSPELVVINLLKYIPQRLGNFDGILGVLVDVRGQLPNDGGLFSRYSFQEEASQYLTYPYDAVGLSLRAEWTVRPGCIDDLTIITETC